MDDPLEEIPDNWKVVGNDTIGGMPTEDQGLIITGLGGVGTMLRYFVVIAAQPHENLKPTFEKEVQKLFSISFRKNVANIEEIIVKNNHIRLTLLIDMDYAVDDIVMPYIEKSNEEKNQLCNHYFAVNTQIPSEADIDNYVRETRSLETGGSYE